MILISMLTGVPNSSVALKEGSSTLGKRDARVSRTPALNGEAVIVHSGVVHCDRTFTIKTTATLAQKATLEYIHENSTLVFVSCAEGLFLGAISSLDTSRPLITMTILVKSKEA